MKKILIILLTMLILNGCSKNADKIISEPIDDNLFIMVTSDLHYTSSVNDSSIIPLMKYNTEITEGIINEVIDKKPDVFVLCGDNTNNGLIEDEKALASLLQKVKDSGIDVIIVPGNHDFNLGTKEDYYSIFKNFINEDKMDPTSKSYIKEIKDTWFFCMNDNDTTDGIIGEFSEETMNWLKTNLEEAKNNDKKIVFISHHTTLNNYTANSTDNYQIQNDDLSDLLKQYNVAIILSGHRHSQQIIRDDNLVEVISSMPIAYPNYVGFININGNDVNYHAESVDIDKYNKIEGIDNFASYSYDLTIEKYEEIAENILSGIDMSDTSKSILKGIFEQYYLYYAKGELYQHIDEIKNNPFYETLMSYVKNTNYGPWMEYMINNTNSSNIEISYEIGG